jgi:chromate reductase, NAD(P)H dehydrogenase (quinone)
MPRYKLGIVVGSNRRESINCRLAQALAKLGAETFEAHFIAIGDLPMYNQNLEQLLPETVVRYKSEISGADALLFVHSRSIPAVLKNAIDWGARPWGKTSWPGRPAAIIGTSGGTISTAVAQQHLRSVLGDLGLHVMGGEACISFRPDLVDINATVPDESVRKFLKAFIDKFTAFVGKFVPVHAQRAA